jgi:hypothetical protein
MNVRFPVLLRPAGRDRAIHVARPVHDIRRRGRIGFRRLFNHEDEDKQE